MSASYSKTIYGRYCQFIIAEERIEEREKGRQKNFQAKSKTTKNIHKSITICIVYAMNSFCLQLLMGFCPGQETLSLYVRAPCMCCFITPSNGDEMILYGGSELWNFYEDFTTVAMLDSSF
jgi:hypothetical protein